MNEANPSAEQTQHDREPATSERKRLGVRSSVRAGDIYMHNPRGTTGN